MVKDEPGVPEKGQVSPWQQAQALQLRARRRALAQRISLFKRSEKHEEATALVSQVEEIDDRIRQLETP